MEFREIEADEGGQHPKADAAEGEHCAKGSDTPEDVREGKMLRRRDRDTRQTESERDGSQRYSKNCQACGGKAPMQLKQNAERCACGERAEGSDAAPGNDFGDVLGARAPDSPHDCASADHAFADAEQEAPQKQKRETDKRKGVEEGGGEGEGTACGTREKAEHCDALGTEDIHHTAYARARENGGDVLGADDESREKRAVAELQVNVHRENGERDADGEVADEGEGDGGKDSCDDAAGKFVGARKSGGVRERRSSGGGGVGHNEESNPYYRVRRGRRENRDDGKKD